MPGLRFAPIVILLSAVTIAFPTFLSAAEHRCDLARAELLQKNGQILEYVAALQKAAQDNELDLVGVLSFKIGELVDDARRLEKEVSACPEKSSSGGSPGLSAAKSEEHQYATMRCPELRERVILLLRKINSMKRRENSLFSRLTEEESAELEAARRQLKLVQEAIRARCSRSPATGPFLNKLRQSGRDQK